MQSPVISSEAKFSWAFEVDTFPFNYSSTYTRIHSPGGSWVTLGLNAFMSAFVHAQKRCSRLANVMIDAVYCRTAS